MAKTKPKWGSWKSPETMECQFPNGRKSKRTNIAAQSFTKTLLKNIAILNGTAYSVWSDNEYAHQIYGADRQEANGARIQT